MAQREILVSAGAEEFVGGTVTDANGEDIGTATFQVSLGSRDNPGAWVTPTISQVGPQGPHQRTLKLRVTSATPKGAYYCWARITDSEITPVRFPVQIIVR